ncbi:tetratricopeptide repeat protein [Flocculibacter collagenilyticus]|uniref:tetratricopeptide repeat protein n=1 Tax=Flocculibacter collagenilyticus TaxID=2744479 RepID=UPI0018F43DDF|nr:tetratricopeptide repeat protein [Flocculibacter collagenilyticus]
MNQSDKLSKLISFWNRDKNNTKLTIDILTCYTQVQDIVGLSAFYQKLPESLMRNHDVQWTYAQCLLNCGEFSKAITTFQSLPDTSDHSKEYAIALCYFLQGKVEDAHALLLNIVSPRENDNIANEIFLLLAKVKYHLGMLEEAQKIALNLSHRGMDNSSELFGLLAMLALDLTDIPASKKYAEQTLSIDDKHHDGLLALASSELYRQNFGECNKIASLGVKYYSRSGRMWSVLGQSQLVLQDADSAYLSLCNATVHMPEHIGTWHVKGWCELTLNRVDDAYKSFKTALDLNRNFAESHGGLAVVSVSQGKHAEAAELVKKALRLDPHCMSAKYAQSLLAELQDNKEEAQTIIESILKQDSHISGISYQQLLQSLKK